jgi:hypothetical protein
LGWPSIWRIYCDEAALLWDTMKGLCAILETGKVSSKSESSKYVLYVLYS